MPDRGMIQEVRQIGIKFLLMEIERRDLGHRVDDRENDFLQLIPARRGRSLHHGSLNFEDGFHLQTLNRGEVIGRSYRLNQSRPIAEDKEVHFSLLAKIVEPTLEFDAAADGCFYLTSESSFYHG